MKKIITSLAALLCIMSANAFTVTHNDKVVENGSTVTFTADDFELVTKIPGVLFSMKAEETFKVAGASGNISLVATSATDKITICSLGGNCYNMSGTEGNYSLTMNSLTEGFNVDLEYNKTDVVPQEVNSTEIAVTADGSTVKFTIVFDTTDNAGVENVAVDNNGVYVVYNLSGVKVLETTEAGEINNLPAGLYLVNGAKVLVK